MSSDSEGNSSTPPGTHVIELGLADPLPADPAVCTTRLHNGLRLVTRFSGRPPGRVAIWLNVGSGSLDETDDERGLAHFLEHLAFRGSENFPPGEMEKRLNAIGLRWDRDRNAFTAMDQTTFTLFLPDTQLQTLSLGLQCLADFAYGLSLHPEQIDKERQVILEEMRAHDSVDARVRERIRSFVLPGSKANDRLPLGLEKVVQTASAEQLRKCYQRLYRPERSAIIVVGDLDLSPLPDLVERFFGQWKSIGGAPRYCNSQVSYPSSIRAKVITDPELVEAQVELCHLHPLRQVRTVGQMRDRLAEQCGLWIVNRRLGAFAMTGNPILRGARASLESMLSVCTRARIVGAGEPGDTAQIVQQLVTELQRVAIHGFLDTEIAAAGGVMLRAAVEAADQEPNRSAESIAFELNSALKDDQVPPSPTQAHRLTAALLPTIGADYARSRFCNLFDPFRSAIIVTAPQREDIELPDETQIINRATSTRELLLEPPEEIDIAKAFMEGTPVAGRIIDQRQTSDMDILSATLDNGLRLHIKPMNIEPNKIFITLTLAGGRIRETHNNAGITAASALVFSQYATSELSILQIQDRLLGRSLKGGGSVGEDMVTLSFETSVKDLEIALQLIHLLLSQPRLDPVTFQRWQDHIARSEEKNRTSVEIQLAQTSLELLSGGDPRFSIISGSRAQAISLEAAQSWLQAFVASAPVEAAIVGDLDQDSTLELALRYLGSLDQRPRFDARLETMRQLHFPAGRSSSTVDVATSVPRAAILSGWRAAPWQEVRERRLLHMADRILDGRLRRELREQRGLTYSANCTFSPSRAYPAASMLTVAFYTSPERSDEALSSASELVERLASSGPSVAELEAARRHFQTIFERLQARPQYWSRILADLDYHGSTIEDLATALDHYLAFPGEAIRATLERYIIESNQIRVICRPCAD